MQQRREAVVPEQPDAAFRQVAVLKGAAAQTDGRQSLSPTNLAACIHHRRRNSVVESRRNHLCRDSPLHVANNLLDEYGTLNAPFANAALPLGSVTRPRTVGVTMNWSFR